MFELHFEASWLLVKLWEVGCCQFDVIDARLTPYLRQVDIRLIFCNFTEDTLSSECSSRYFCLIWFQNGLTVCHVLKHPKVT